MVTVSVKTGVSVTVCVADVRKLLVVRIVLECDLTIVDVTVVMATVERVKVFVVCLVCVMVLVLRAESDRRSKEA